MQLSDYMDRNGLNDDTFGKLIGRDRTSVYRLRAGLTKPTADLLQTIADKTGGAVTPNDFFDLPDEAAA
jgi:hypothetical protein